MADRKPQLGEKTTYPDHYDPGLLVAIPRAEGRNLLSIPRPMRGEDIWTAYELSWLTAKGKPCVAVGEFRVSCESPAIVESKSLKLYLNSINQRRFDGEAAVKELLVRDLSREFGDSVAVSLYNPDAFGRLGIQALPGTCLDGLNITCDVYERAPDVLDSEADEIVEEQLYSHLLKSNCPVTGQPDWASVLIEYRGPKISRAGLLKYLVSYRQHQDFHENCVETIFCDILHRCRPKELTVYARYTRRGGLDINPYRTTTKKSADFSRLARQ